MPTTPGPSRTPRNLEEFLRQSAPAWERMRAAQEQYQHSRLRDFQERCRQVDRQMEQYRQVLLAPCKEPPLECRVLVDRLLSRHRKP